MPDIHFGYGFPIGGVAAFSVDEGVVSPGGVGYDINCGCPPAGDRPRQRRTSRASCRRWSTSSSATCPPGVGASGAIAKLSRPELEQLLVQGAAWAVEHGYGSKDDLVHTEDGGALPGADPGAVSERAYTRGLDQVGTLGSGNHFLEIQVVDEIFDPEAAAAFGLRKGQITVMVHCGSRGFGYQVCEDYLAGHGRGQRTLRHRAARPPAGLRSGRVRPRASTTSRPWPARPTTPGPTGR